MPVFFKIETQFAPGRADEEEGKVTGPPWLDAVPARNTRRGQAQSPGVQHAKPGLLPEPGKGEPARSAAQKSPAAVRPGSGPCTPSPTPPGQAACEG